jgi:hypothetical protein
MATKDIQPIETPLTFEEWKGDLAPSFDDKMIKSMERLHNINYKTEFDEMLKREYQEYLSNFNGNWLLK